MAEVIQLKTEPRPGKGSRNSVRLRKAGRVPAVVYGHKEAVAAVSVSRDELASALRHHARTLELVVAGKTETVLIQEVQHDHLGTGLVHIDFRRVSKDERVRTTVEIELRGTAPGATGGGVLDQPLHKIHIECPAMAIPESIRVKIDGLLLGQAIHVKELDLPAGVKALEDPDLVVVQVKQQVALVVEPTAPLGEAGAAEPEIITKKKEKPAEEE
ncbi:MAG TPA: 50S ribosomal protein L25 [Gemmataceae bacterium]|jgi:large subunit ribosomal protein L25|nr:50S ribosomal protein L25 [Gemmataceae bacterium]